MSESGLTVETSMTDETLAPKVRCNGHDQAAGIFGGTSAGANDGSGAQQQHSIACDSEVVAQFIWISDRDSSTGLSLCEVSVVAASGPGDDLAADEGWRPLNIVVHSSGYIVDQTPPDETTPAPTLAPTAPDVPTPAPTIAPTAPTKAPTSLPTPAPTKAPDCTNSLEDGMETDTDCGGPFCPRCENDQRCYEDLDCKAGMEQVVHGTGNRSHFL
jgi:hypothetical protein